MNIFQKVTTKTLKKNRVRTLVTIIGIILSAAMFTAVTVTVSSFQQYMIDVVKAIDGSWFVNLSNIADEEARTVLSDSRVDNVVVFEQLGYSRSLMEESINEDKPYLYVTGATDNITELLPIRLTEGRMPQNDSEVLVPKHLSTNGGVKLEIGQTLSLELGKRICEGNELLQSDSLKNGLEGGFNEDTGEWETKELYETFEAEYDKNFTVTGIYERPSFENYSAPGYTLLTIDNSIRSSSNTDNLRDVYLTLSEMGDSSSFLDEYKGKCSETAICQKNGDLLRYSGMSMEDSYNAVLYTLAGLFIAIIMFGSISLIYNAFSISLSERTKQFGLMKSIGATKKQIMGSVLFEGFSVSAIAIPIGVLSGIIGIAVTFKFLSKPIGRMLGRAEYVEFSVHASVPAIIIAVIVCIITVLISAYIPARRAVKQQPIEAVRQSNDISINAKSLKGGRLTGKLFGLEGLLASKNFKRSRKKYRATIISLFASIVLFISASSFCAYLTDSVDTVISEADYDIKYYYSQGNSKASLSDTLDMFRQTQGVEEVAYALENYIQIEIPESLYSEDFNTFSEEKNIENLSMTNELMIYFIEDDVYRQYLTSKGYSTEVFMNTENPQGLICDNMRVYNIDRYYTFNLLNQEKLDLRVKVYIPSEDHEKEPEYKTSYLQVGGRTEEGLFFLNSYNMYSMYMMYPYSARYKVMQNIKYDNDTSYFDSASIYLTADNHAVVYEKLIKELEDRQLDTSRLYDNAESTESNRTLILIIQVFSYGFVVLISLIAAANVFNTISTNINLRRREFAMLRSVGMTDKGMNKMMNYECLLYGMKSLILGIPVSIGNTWLIFKSINNGLETEFYIPWISIAIAVGSVFAVVFSTMLYSMSKVKKDNPIDALRNENI